MAECQGIDPLCWGADAANSLFGGMVEGLYDGAVELAKIIGTWWMEVPPPNLNSPGLNLLQQDLSWFVWVFAVIGFFIGLIRLVMTEDVRSGAVNLAKPIINLVLATGVYMAAVPILLTAGDETARWLLDRSTEGNSSMDMQILIPSTGALAGNHGVAFVVYLLMLLGAGVNFMFMIFRNLMLVILMAFIAVVAAASGTESGNQAWRKANGWLIALLLFKPVAAGIYALGFRLMIDDTDISQNSDLGAGMVSALTGLLILVLAALALPGLIKFIVPAAAVGSGGFSGGAALSGAAGVAAGAAVLATGVGAGAMAARGGAGALTATGAGTSTGAGSSAGAAGSSGASLGAGGSGGGSSSAGAGPAGGASSAAESAAGTAPAAGGAGSGSSTGAGSAEGGASPQTTGATGGTAAAGAAAEAGPSTGATSEGSAAPGAPSSASGAPTSTSAASGADGAPAAGGAPTGAESLGAGSSGVAAGGASERGQWAEAINRYTQASQAGSQAAEGARVDRVLDDEGDR